MKLFDTALPRLRACALVALVAVLAAGCASRTHKAPVEQRQPAAATQVPVPPAATQPHRPCCRAARRRECRQAGLLHREAG